jgi:hypothetical protein
MLHRRSDLHREAECFGAANKASGDLGFLSALDIVRAEFVVDDVRPG